MAKIKIDVEALKSNAALLDARIAELQSLNQRLEALIARIQASWEGQASIIYIAKMIAQATKAKKMVDVLLEYKKYVETTIQKFSTIDDNSANKIRNSF
ncbi:MAG: WXG100 family type VII secretion target [Clostridia bacterium]|nr:WXG100 family type VII secretion target [Clostridia bacterium]